MLIRLLIILTISGSIIAQSSFDILNTPSDSRDAALGISLNPTVKPTRLLTDPEHNVTLSVWNWVADIQGAYMGIALNKTHISVQALHSGELEYRNEVPTVEPLSTFEYALFNFGLSHAEQWNNIFIGLGAEIVYERTLNASATGLSMNLDAAYELNKNLLLSGGLRHWGVSGKLDQESTTLPTEAWFGLDAELGKLTVLTEVNSGSYPLAAGLAYPIIQGFMIAGGLQVETAEPAIQLHPSAGFTLAWTSFELGYTIYQFDHNLGPRHFITLYWNY